MAALVRDEKCGIGLGKKAVFLLTNAAGYQPEQVLPSTTDGASLGAVERQMMVVVSYECENC